MVTNIALNDMPEASKTLFLKGLLYDAKPCFILAGLGGNTGSYLVQELAELADQLNIKLHIIVTTPFEFERKPRKILAKEIIEKLKLSNSKLSIISNAEMIDSFYGKLGLVGSFASIHQKFYDIISQKIKPVEYPFPNNR